MGANEGASAMTRDQAGVYLDGLPPDEVVDAFVKALKWVFTGPPILMGQGAAELRQRLEGC